MRVRASIYDGGTSAGSTALFRAVAAPETNVYLSDPSADVGTYAGTHFVLSGARFTAATGDYVSLRLDVETTNDTLRDYFVTAASNGTVTRSGAYFRGCTDTSSQTTGGFYRNHKLTLDFTVSNSCHTEFLDLVHIASHGDVGAAQIVQYIVGTDCSTDFARVFDPTASMSEEEREAYERRRHEMEQRRLETERERALEAERRRTRQLKAEGKGLRLLMSLLNTEQWESLCGRGHFDVPAPNGKTYRLFFALHGNVQRLNHEMVPEKAYCGHMGGELPVADTLVSQRLILSHAPEKYEKAANPVNHEHTGWCRPRDDFKDFIRLALETAA
jgi:hypothetical protein